MDDVAGIHSEPSVSGLTGGANFMGYPFSFENPSLLVHHRDVASGATPGVPDVSYERPNSVRRTDGPPVPAGESNVLFVDGLPTDCTRREIGRILAILVSFDVFSCFFVRFFFFLFNFLSLLLFSVSVKY